MTHRLNPQQLSELERIRDAVVSVVEADTRVVAVYLFGSRARGDALPGSDIDLAVLAREAFPVMELLSLQNALEEACGENVDLIDLISAPAFLALEAIRGERLSCHDGRFADEFDLYVMRRAADLAPFERARRRYWLGDAPIPYPSGEAA